MKPEVKEVVFRLAKGYLVGVGAGLIGNKFGLSLYQTILLAIAMLLVTSCATPPPVKTPMEMCTIMCRTKHVSEYQDDTVKCGCTGK